MKSLSESRLRVLVLYANYTDRLSYYDDWLDAFRSAPEFEVITVDIVPSDACKRIQAVIGEVDAIVLLHSTNGDTTLYLEPHISALADRRVPLLTFVGNEVNLPGSPIAEKRSVFQRLGPDFIATQLLAEAGEYLFGDLAQRSVISIPHALNPDAYRAVSGNNRPIDIGARAVRYLPHLGDDDRNRILQHFNERASDFGMTVDISDQRFDRVGWAAFLNRCKGTVATEAGSWFLERDDATVNEIRDYVLSSAPSGIVIRNDSKLRALGHKMPWQLRSLARRLLKKGLVRHEALINEELNSKDILEKFFADRPRPPVYGKCISSRHFDAIGTKTCQIMFRGRYNGILEADRHYLALESDFSNVGDVLERFRDPKIRSDITESAFDLVMSKHTYAQRMRQIYAVLTGSDVAAAATKIA